MHAYAYALAWSSLDYFPVALSLRYYIYSKDRHLCFEKNEQCIKELHHSPIQPGSNAKQWFSRNSTDAYFHNTEGNAMKLSPFFLCSQHKCPLNSRTPTKSAENHHAKQWCFIYVFSVLLNSMVGVLAWCCRKHRIQHIILSSSTFITKDKVEQYIDNTMKQSFHIYNIIPHEMIHR